MEEPVMKKDMIFAPVMLVIGILLFLLKVTGVAAHIAVAVAGIFVLAVYTAATQKEWKLPALEIVMRVCYGIALITGIAVIKLKDTLALQIAHKAGAILFVVLLVALFVHKLVVNEKVKH
jgi:hypothetical protein